MADLIRRLGLDTRIKQILATASIAGAVYGGFRIAKTTRKNEEPVPDLEESHEESTVDGFVLSMLVTQEEEPKKLSLEIGGKQIPLKTIPIFAEVQNAVKSATKLHVFSFQSQWGEINNDESLASAFESWDSEELIIRIGEMEEEFTKIVKDKLNAISGEAQEDEEAYLMTMINDRVCLGHLMSSLQQTWINSTDHRKMQMFSSNNEFIEMAITDCQHRLMDMFIHKRLQDAGITRETIVDSTGITKVGYTTLWNFMHEQIFECRHELMYISDKYGAHAITQDFSTYLNSREQSLPDITPKFMNDFKSTCISACGLDQEEFKQAHDAYNEETEGDIQQRLLTEKKKREASDLIGREELIKIWTNTCEFVSIRIQWADIQVNLLDEFTRSETLSDIVLLNTKIPKQRFLQSSAQISSDPALFDLSFSIFTTIQKRKEQLTEISGPQTKKTLLSILNTLKEHSLRAFSSAAEMFNHSRERNEPIPENFGQQIEVGQEGTLSNICQRSNWTRETFNKALEQYAQDTQVQEVWNWWNENKKKAVDMTIEPFIKTIPESLSPLSLLNFKKEEELTPLLSLYDAMKTRPVNEISWLPDNEYALALFAKLYIENQAQTKEAYLRCGLTGQEASAEAILYAAAFRYASNIGYFGQAMEKQNYAELKSRILKDEATEEEIAEMRQWLTAVQTGDSDIKLEKDTIMFLLQMNMNYIYDAIEKDRQTYLAPRRQYWEEQDISKYRTAAFEYHKWWSYLFEKGDEEVCKEQMLSAKTLQKNIEANINDIDKMDMEIFASAQKVISRDISMFIVNIQVPDYLKFKEAYSNLLDFKMEQYRSSVIEDDIVINYMSQDDMFVRFGIDEAQLMSAISQYSSQLSLDLAEKMDEYQSTFAKAHASLAQDAEITYENGQLTNSSKRQVYAYIATEELQESKRILAEYHDKRVELYEVDMVKYKQLCNRYLAEISAVEERIYSRASDKFKIDIETIKYSLGDHTELKESIEKQLRSQVEIPEELGPEKMKEVYRHYTAFVRAFPEQNELQTFRDGCYLTLFLVFDEIYKRFGADEIIFHAAKEKYRKDLELVQLYLETARALSQE